MQASHRRSAVFSTAPHRSAAAQSRIATPHVLATETIFAASDVTLLTSDNEGMPVSLIEAAMCGVPAVATRVGSVGEVIDDGVTGLLCPLDADALRARVKARLAVVEEGDYFALLGVTQAEGIKMPAMQELIGIIGGEALAVGQHAGYGIEPIFGLKPEEMKGTNQLLEKLMEKQSSMSNMEERKKIVWEIDKKLLEDNRDKLDRIAEAALERETLDHTELEACVEGRELPVRERVVIPRYSEKAAKAKEKRKASIFQPRPREVPTGS